MPEYVQGRPVGTCPRCGMARRLDKPCSVCPMLRPPNRVERLQDAVVDALHWLADRVRDLGPSYCGPKRYRDAAERWFRG